MTVQLRQREASPAVGRVDRLTSIRFFAAAWVILFHVNGYLHGHNELLHNGEVAVDLFFVLSGFILAHVYDSKFVSLSWGSYGTFLARRLARIYPAHLVMLAIWIAYFVGGRLAGIPSVTPERYSLPAILTNVLMIQAWGFDDSLTWNYPAWSISAEWFAYLLFPPLCFVLHRAGRARPWVGLLLAEALLVVLDQTLDALHRTYDVSLLRIAPEFLAGIFLWQLKDRVKLPYPDVLLALVVVGFAAAAASTSDRLPLVLIGQALIFLTYQARGPLGRLLSLRPLVYLGETSYSLYMVHAFVLSLVFRLLTAALPVEALQAATPLVMLGILIAAQLAASALFHFVEEPVRQAIAGRRRNRQAWSIAGRLDDLLKRHPRSREKADTSSIPSAVSGPDVGLSGP